jgi:hypothetical protein
MQEHRIPKKSYAGAIGGRRAVGRPRSRWVDVVRIDAELLLGIRNWKTAARNR